MGDLIAAGRSGCFVELPDGWTVSTLLDASAQSVHSVVDRLVDHPPGDDDVGVVRRRLHAFVAAVAARSDPAARIEVYAPAGRVGGWWMPAAIVATDRPIDERPPGPDSRIDTAEVGDVELDDLRGRRVDRTVCGPDGDLRRQVSYVLRGRDDAPLLEFAFSTLALDWSDGRVTDPLVELFDAIMMTLQVDDTVLR